MIRSLSILLLLASSAFGGWPDKRIVCMEDGGTGSFVRIGECTMILSCAHRTIDTSVERGCQVRYACADDSQGTATVIAVYPFDINSKPFRDVAIYSTDRQPPAGTEPLRLTNRETPKNAKVWVVGFPGPAMQFSSRTTQIVGYDGMLLLAGQSIPGESGGPIINEQGEIVGTLSGNIGDVTYGCAGVVIGDLFREVKTTWCPNGRCSSYPQQQQWWPIQPPIRQELPPPPQPLNQPIQQPPAQPQIDWPAKYDKLESDFAELNAAVYKLQKQVASYKECNCGNSEAHVTAAEVNGAITSAIASIHFPQPEKPQPPNYDAIAAEVAKRLPPINMRVTPQAPYQKVNLGSYVTLPLDKQPQTP